MESGFCSAVLHLEEIGIEQQSRRDLREECSWRGLRPQCNETLISWSDHDTANANHRQASRLSVTTDISAS